jgi:hypothetical protein
MPDCSPIVGDTSTNPADAEIEGGNGSVARDPGPIEFVMGQSQQALAAMWLSTGGQLGPCEIPVLIGAGCMTEVEALLGSLSGEFRGCLPMGKPVHWPF